MKRLGLSVILATLALLGPPIFVASQNWDAISQLGHVDAKTSRGYVLFFTAPG